MKKPYPYILGSLSLLMLLLACEKLELPQRVFIELKLADFELNSIELVQFVADLSSPDADYSEDISDLGFVWSNDNSVPALNDAQSTAIPQNESIKTGATFQTSFQPEDLNKAYFVRAYARVEGKEYYSSVKSFDFRQVGTSINASDNAISNNTVQLSGSLFGMNDKSGSLSEYGFLFAEQSIVDENSADRIISFGQSTDENVFFDTLISELDFNTTYYARAFTTFNGKKLLSDNQFEIPIKDGWELVSNNKQAFQRAAGAVWTIENGNVYFGLGCQDLGCTREGSDPGIYQLQPSSGEVTQIYTLADSLKRSSPAYFTYNNQLYFGLGEILETDGAPIQYLQDFYVFNPQTLELNKLADFPEARSRVVSKVVGDYAYVGLGRSQAIDGTENRLDFYRISLTSPETGWQPLASAINLYCNLMDTFSEGRFDPVVFTTPDALLVGLGRISGSQRLNNFVQFNLPTDSQALGEWVELECAPQRLSGAAGIQINERFYFGTGSTASKEYTSEWWEWDPLIGFENRVPFQGSPREEAIHFNEQGNGYLLGGRIRRIDQQGGEIDEYFPELWRYVPPIN